MIQTVIIGSGNVAVHLTRIFSKNPEVSIVQIANRKGISIADVPVASHFSSLVDADVYILAVSDDAIAKLASQIPFKGKLVVHTSGSVSMQALPHDSRKGVLYPLQTFSKDKDLVYENIPFCIEAQNETDYQLLKKMVYPISQNIFRINSDQRKQLHLAAVFVCNFVNHLYQIGYVLTQQQNLPFDLLKPLIRETANKIENAVPKEVQTGPAKRNDQKTMAKHMEMLALPEYKQIYKLLSKAIINTDERNKL